MYQSHRDREQAGEAEPQHSHAPSCGRMSSQIKKRTFLAPGGGATGWSPGTGWTFGGPGTGSGPAGLAPGRVAEIDPIPLVLLGLSTLSFA